jgi:hypothetical protein
MIRKVLLVGTNTREVLTSGDSRVNYTLLFAFVSCGVGPDKRARHLSLQQSRHKEQNKHGPDSLSFYIVP